MSVKVKGLPIRPATEERQSIGQWEIAARQSHILRSSCKCQDENNDTAKCNFCSYSSSLNIPLPEMIFDRNTLTLIHLRTGCKLQFNTLDALKLVDDKDDLIKVSYSKEWMAKRQDSSHIKNTPKPFDWTYTTRYTGSLSPAEGYKMVERPTTEEPDQEKLLRRDAILYHTEVVMFEDELADNGSSKLVVKCRVMADFVLVLLRFYLRVDRVMVRVQETRWYCEREWGYLLREVVEREAGYSELRHLGSTEMFDEVGINKHLPVVKKQLVRVDIVTDS